MVRSTLLEDLLFDLPHVVERTNVFPEDAVRETLLLIVEGEDLQKYIA